MADYSLNDPIIRRKLEDYTIPEPNSGCLLWLGAANVDGYGVIERLSKTHAAHRLAWMAAHGPIPAKLHVLHKCDVRACVNPTHLFLGTNADNVADKVAKNRHRSPLIAKNVPRGESHRATNLTSDAVREIRSAAGSQRKLATRFGISQARVSAIRLRKTWRHVD